MLLPEWCKDGYYEKQNEVLRADTFKDTIERIHIDKISTADFIEKFERGSKPVIIEGVAEGWPAWQTWQVNVSQALPPLFFLEIT